MTAVQDAPPTTGPKAVMQRYLDALTAGDQAAILESFTEDATWTVKTDLPLAGPWRGREAIVHDFLGQMAAWFEPGSITIDVGGFIAEGGTVVLEWTGHGRTSTGAGGSVDRQPVSSHGTSPAMTPGAATRNTALPAAA